MAFKKHLIQRLFNLSKISNPAISSSRCRISSSSSANSLRRPDPDKSAPDPGDVSISQRLLHNRHLYKSAATSPEVWSLPKGIGLLAKLREMDFSRDRIRLEGLNPPAVRSESPERELTMEDAKKVLKLSQMEMVKTRLRQLQQSSVSYSEFVELCIEASSNTDQGLEFARMLDQSGHVIVLGNTVFLKPEQVMKAIRGLMPVSVAHPNDLTKFKDLEDMEKQKAIIDKKAESLVRRELWCGLGFLVVQTAAFVRLTFWELSWDVMEPICFYVTSAYFMTGYAFFLRTNKEPSYEGFFRSRFSAKQKKLMKAQNFDVERYNELLNAYYPPHLGPQEIALPYDNNPQDNIR